MSIRNETAELARIAEELLLGISDLCDTANEIRLAASRLKNAARRVNEEALCVNDEIFRETYSER